MKLYLVLMSFFLGMHSFTSHASQPDQALRNRGHSIIRYKVHVNFSSIAEIEGKLFEQLSEIENYQQRITSYQSQESTNPFNPIDLHLLQDWLDLQQAHRKTANLLKVVRNPSLHHQIGALLIEE